MRIKTIALGCAFALSLTNALSFAEMVEVYTWKAFPGKGAEMINTFTEAKGIHEEAGASVAIVQRMTGSTQEVDYVMRWDDATAWGASMDAANSPKMAAKWQSFLAKASLNPSGEMVGSVSGTNLDSSKKASDFDGSLVYGAWVWKVAPEKRADFVERVMTSKKIHESLGARVEVYAESVGGTGNMHYVMFWDSYSDWAESVDKMSSSKEWAAQQANRDSSVATLIASHRGQTVVPQ